ncbi:zinc-coordinating transcription factor [Saccharomycopsis crataegensis]|uniref:Zinc-coordinating transcription factor n=1 Tax=Saccharomycopsis crataegensis TaxID=43959 RepID=A0AAV5QVD7_9ASCO|nr:zinc-coordinating transcription factor [Saccharomycopsis crataegensis]
MNSEFSVNIHPGATGDTEMFDFDFDTAMANDPPSFNHNSSSAMNVNNNNNDFDFGNQMTAPIDIAYQRSSPFGYRGQQQSQNTNNTNNNNNMSSNVNSNTNANHNNNNINNINQFLNNPRLRRESIAHTQGMGGVSFGSLTIGSWLKDEVLFHHNGVLNSNGNPSNQNNNQNNPTFNILGNLNNNQNNAMLNMNQDLMMTMSPPPVNYLPNLEADYCKDYSCCGDILPTLHDLLKHYEEAHISISPPSNDLVVNGDGQVTSNNSKNLKRSNDLMEAVSTNEVFLSNNANNNNHNNGSGIQVNNGVMNLDNNLLGNANNLDINQMQQPNNSNSLFTFNGSLGHQLNNIQDGSNVNNVLMKDNNNSNNNNNNIHQFGNYQLNSSNLSNNLSNQFSQNNQNMNMNNNSNNNANQTDIDLQTSGIKPNGDHSSNKNIKKDEDEEICIDDPARHLYVDGENRPFKCPVIGCDKTYKNQNGLKYHKAHGHQNQKLFENPDGTFSVIDPESNQPYPDGSFNLEKDKPFRCEVCGKRYKNLNGLKYHRGHSTH